MFFLILSIYLPSKITDEVLKLNKNFEYYASVISNYKTYNQETQQYTENQQSNSFLYYKAVGEENGNLIINSIFYSKKTEGQNIFSVDRQYGINKKNRSHVAYLGDTRRAGFLFAPKDLEEGQDFIYWHVNYNEPAFMKYVAKDKIGDLDVYKYESFLKANQTKDLLNNSNIAGVPEKFQIISDVKMTAWFEPITGNLINYKDQSNAFFYDNITNQKLYPWIQYINNFDQSSINRLIKNTEIEKNNILNIKILSTIILVFLLLICFFLVYMNQKMGISISGVFGLLTVFVGLMITIGWFLNLEFLGEFFNFMFMMELKTSISFIFVGIIVMTACMQRNDYIKKYFDIKKIYIVIVSIFSIILLISVPFLNFVFNKGVICTSEISNKYDYSFFVKFINSEPSVGSLISFFIISFIALIIANGKFVYKKSVNFLSVVLITIGILAILGYIFDIKFLYFVLCKENTNGMAIHSAILFVMAGISFLKINNKTKI